MSLHLDGATALITGASSGIGRATAQVLAQLGASVVLTARRQDRLAALADEITKGGGNALAVPADITDACQAATVVDAALQYTGHLDIVINNAGLLLPGPVESAPVQEWDRMISINMQGLLYVAGAALPHLVKAAAAGPRQVADLVNVSSVSGRRTAAGSAVYNMTKWGVNGFSDSLREEVTARHVRVSLVEPGVVATELPDHMREEIRAVPNPAFSGFEPLEATDIADAIAYVVTRPRRVAVNEIMVRPTGQVA